MQVSEDGLKIITEGRLIHRLKLTEDAKPLDTNSRRFESDHFILLPRPKSVRPPKELNHAVSKIVSRFLDVLGL